jgi:hypothetical protein
VSGILNIEPNRLYPRVGLSKVPIGDHCHRQKHIDLPRL